MKSKNLALATITDLVKLLKRFLRTHHITFTGDMTVVTESVMFRSNVMKQFHIYKTGQITSEFRPTSNLDYPRNGFCCGIGNFHQPKGCW